MWSATLKKCVINCANDIYATGSNPSDTQSCLCQANFIWETTALKCVRNCALYAGTNGF